MISRASRSAEGSAKLFKKAMATASIPLATSSRVNCSTNALSSSCKVVPSASVRCGTPRREQRGTRTGALNDRIGHQGCAMDELLHASYGNPLTLKRFEHERFDGLGWIARRGVGFANREATGSIVEHNEVRERAPNIHPYPALPGGTSHHSTSSLGKRLNGKISTCGERC